MRTVCWMIIIPIDETMIGCTFFYYQSLHRTSRLSMANCGYSLFAGILIPISFLTFNNNYFNQRFLELHRSNKFHYFLITSSFRSCQNPNRQSTPKRPSSRVSGRRGSFRDENHDILCITRKKSCESIHIISYSK